MTISIEIANFQYRYQRRAWWQLSSLADQTKTNLPSIVYTLNYHKNDPGIELTKKLLSTFKDKVNINNIEWDNDSFFRRGFTRTNDIKNASCDFLLFVDSDEVFHPDFFSSLTPLLSEWKEKGNNKCIAAIRRTMEISDGNALVNNETYEDSPIKNWHEKILSINTKVISGARGTGGFQIFNVEKLKENKFFEYGGHRDTPVNSIEHFVTKSEIRFRKQMGVDPTYAGLIKPLYHLNHERNEARKEILIKNPDYIF
jgi:hypothetical protein